MTDGDARDHLDYGRRAEARVEALLRAAGMQILDRNYRTPRGEIDLVVRDGDTVVFVEVRARRSEAFGSPAETVDGRKRRAIGRAARAWLAAHALEEARIRFDVAAVNGAACERIEMIRDAFGVADPWE